MNHPYRFPAIPQFTISMASGPNRVRVIEDFGGHGQVEKVWPIEDYRKAHRGIAPQDLAIPVEIRSL